MKNYDWIVVGGGIAGSALSYELAQVGFSVLLLEQSATPQSATRYSYGGIAYWSGTTELTRQICKEAIALHRNLSMELDGDTQFRELNLLLTIASNRDPNEVAAMYSHFDLPPALLSLEAACELEPLLNREAIAGALLLRHGHVSPESTVNAYNQAFVRAGGKIQIAQATGLAQSDLAQSGNRITGVITPTETFTGANVVIAAGAMSRALLRKIGLSAPLYFTQAEVVETPPVDLQLQALVMPAELRRFAMEAEAGQAETDSLWDEPGHEVVAAIMDAGVIQFQDGSLRMGQLSRTLTDPYAQVDVAQSEAEIRGAVGQILPALQHLPGDWRSCMVSFSGDRLPLIGALPNASGVHLFSGFSNPFALLPPLARRFAQSVAGRPDEIIDQLSPNRFVTPIHA